MVCRILFVIDAPPVSSPSPSVRAPAVRLELGCGLVPSIVSLEMIRPMMISNIYLMIFAVAMTGCVLATPLVTWVATWVGAIDRPDHFRRIHKGAIPRLGGLALALGVAAGTILTQLHDPLRQRAVGEFGAHLHWSLLVAALVILVVGFIDDTRSLGPRIKLLGQALAVLTLYLGGIRIQSIDVLGLNLDLGFPSAQFERDGVSRSSWRSPAWSSRCSGSSAA